jgi:high-affinity Fe2+/Pb2+ permease
MRDIFAQLFAPNAQGQTNAFGSNPNALSLAGLIAATGNKSLGDALPVAAQIAYQQQVQQQQQQQAAQQQQQQQQRMQTLQGLGGLMQGNGQDPKAFNEQLFSGALEPNEIISFLKLKEDQRNSMLQRGNAESKRRESAEVQQLINSQFGGQGEQEGSQPVSPEIRQQALLLAKTGKIKEAIELMNGTGADTKEVFNKENTLRDEYIKQSNDFKIINDAYPRILSSAQDPSPAGDIALIFNFMKMLDPKSVVRESEYATAENAASIPEAIRKQYNKAITGEKLTPKIRADYVSRSGKLYNTQYKNQQKLIKNYEGLSSRNKVNPENVVIDYRSDDTMGLPKQQEDNNYTPIPNDRPTADQAREILARRRQMGR